MQLQNRLFYELWRIYDLRR